MEKTIIKSAVYSFLIAFSLLIILTPTKYVQYDGTTKITTDVGLAHYIVGFLRISLAVALAAALVAALTTLYQRRR